MPEDALFLEPEEFFSEEFYDPNAQYEVVDIQAVVDYFNLLLDLQRVDKELEPINPSSDNDDK